jgi:DNA helicase-2/ATP-dependent DNA helicase PcrA
MPDLERLLEARRGFTVAAAGCGKTQLLTRLASDERSGRQLVLTHTHAGVAALKKRLDDARTPIAKFHLDTIAGWCLRYGAAFPSISGVTPETEAQPDWSQVYVGAEKVIRSQIGRRVIAESYSGALVDEYQDCTQAQHRVVMALADVLPCRGVGDPMQAIFGFRHDPSVGWSDIRASFEPTPPLLHPWRWERAGCNVALGRWLVEAREQLETTGKLYVAEEAPVNWVAHGADDERAATCRRVGSPQESTVAILRRPPQCIELAKRLGGRWPVVERFDNGEVFACAREMAGADGRTAVAALFAFLRPRMTGISTDLKRIADAITDGRSTSLISKNREHLERLHRLAETPSPETALAALEGVLAHDGWWLYRQECVHQLRAALREIRQGQLDALPDAVAAARTRARHRGRCTHRRTIGTPLLVKGLEFDHAVVLWEPERFGPKGLYVAITRGSKSLTIVSRSRTLVPSGT